MATKYGPNYAFVSGVHGRLILTANYSPSNVTSSTSSVTVSWALDVQMRTSGGSAHDTGAVSVAGDDSWSGNVAWNINGYGDKYRLASGSDVTSLNYGSTQGWSIDASLVNVVLGNLFMDPLHLTLPARPYVKPAAPSGLGVAWVSDSRNNLSWTNNNTTAAPYQYVEVWRSADGGSEVRVARLSGSATSYADTKIEKNHRYTYRLRATNSAGVSGYSASNSSSTTPATPGAPTVKKQPNGDILITSPALSPVAASWEIKEFGGATLVTGLSAGQASWPHPAPDPTKLWSYIIRAVSSDPVLYGDWSPASAPIQIIAPPYAPTGLLPVVADADEDITNAWAHNPVDTSEQTAYEFQYRLSPAGPWVGTGKVVSGVSEHLTPAGTWANDSTVERQVRTWGAHADPGPWSAVNLLELSARPVAGITSPGALWDSQHLRVEWTYYDAEAGAMTSWVVTLRDAAGQFLETRSGNSPALAVDMDTILADNTDYIVEVSVRDAAGMWSLPTEVPFPVQYALPPAPALVATWLPDDGYTVLAVTAAAPLPTEETIDHVRLERIAPAGGWTRVASDLQPGDIVTDPIPPLGQAVTYRAVTVSTIGSEAYSAFAVVETDTDWVFINYGPGFGSVARVWGNLEAGRSYKPTKTLQRYAGNVHSTVRGGIARDEGYDLTATLFAPWADPDPSSTWDELRAAVDELLVCLRDPEGTRLFGTFTGTDLSNALEIHRPVSLPFVVTNGYVETTTP